jgi:hypothetical protein
MASTRIFIIVAESAVHFDGPGPTTTNENIRGGNDANMVSLYTYEPRKPEIVKERILRKGELESRTYF